jgi:hypothetical protein
VLHCCVYATKDTGDTVSLSVKMGLVMLW